MQLEDFARSKGFTADELTEYGITIEGDHVRIPTLGRHGEWYARIRCNAGCHPKYSGPKGEPLHLYNPLGLGPQSGEVWIAEGEFDTLSLILAGAPAVGILGTGGFKNHWALLFEGAVIVLALDPDKAGRERAEKMAQLWPDHQHLISVFDPSPYGDLNDWFKDDFDGFGEAVENHGR